MTVMTGATITIATLKAARVPMECIVRVCEIVELEAAERRAAYRERERIRKRNQRARARGRAVHVQKSENPNKINDRGRDVALDTGASPSMSFPPSPPLPNNPPLLPSSPISKPNPTRAVASRRAPAGDEAFKKFMEAYPRRDGANPRAPAAKRLRQALKAGAELEAILAGVQAYRAELERTGKLGTRFVAMAATWLAQSRWQDYQPGSQQPARPAPPAKASLDLEAKARDIREREEWQLQQRAAAAELERKRKDRPTLAELKAKYGPNWGIEVRP